jgi:hypothetical protein
MHDSKSTSYNRIVDMSDVQSNADYDFCIVFPAEDGTFTEKGKHYVRSLRKLGFEMYAYSGVREGKEIFVLLRTPLSKLRAYADIIDFKMKLDGTVAQHLIEKGDQEHNIAPVVIADKRDITPLHPYEHIYAKYSRKVPESLYAREEGAEHPFNDIIRLKLSAMLLESRVEGAQNLKIRRYIRSGWLLGCYPLHDQAKKDAIWAEWREYPRKPLPLTRFKDYFGEKNGLYFAFMQHFVNFLAIPAIVGVPLQVAVFVTGDYSGTDSACAVVVSLPYRTYIRCSHSPLPALFLAVHRALGRVHARGEPSRCRDCPVVSYQMLADTVCTYHYCCISSGSARRSGWRWSGAPSTSRPTRWTGRVSTLPLALAHNLTDTDTPAAAAAAVSRRLPRSGDRLRDRRVQGAALPQQHAPDLRGAECGHRGLPDRAGGGRRGVHLRHPLHDHRGRGARQCAARGVGGQRGADPDHELHLLLHRQRAV